MDIVNSLRCPVTHELMSMPVVAQDGHTYEYEVIALWLLDHDTSPMTRQRMTAHLHPNQVVAQLTAQLIERQPELISEVHEMACITAILRAKSLGWRPTRFKVSPFDFAYSYDSLTRADRYFIFEYVELSEDVFPTIADSRVLLDRYRERGGSLPKDYLTRELGSAYLVACILGNERYQPNPAIDSLLERVENTVLLDFVLEILQDKRLLARHHTCPDVLLAVKAGFDGASSINASVDDDEEMVVARLQNKWAKTPGVGWPKVRSIEIARRLRPSRGGLRFFTSAVRKHYKKERSALRR